LALINSVAQKFSFPGPIVKVTEFGSGNVNDTFLVNIDHLPGPDKFILQRINPTVFPEPELIMRNLRVLTEHVQHKLATGPAQNRRWQLPAIIATREGQDFYRHHDNSFWRALTFIEQTASHEIIQSEHQAEQAGRALGIFHCLSHDLPPDKLYDTLPGFHVTPNYLAHYDRMALQPATGNRGADLTFCRQFIDQRRAGVDILEKALRQGVLRQRIIHGDPKAANILFDQTSQQAVSIIDLDTTKAGLIHYDIGDCLRSCCNPAGEDGEHGRIEFRLDLAGSILQGYLKEVRSFFTAGDYDYIYDAVRLIAFELGLRFFSDHLAGDRYFKTRRPDHNLDRAMGQFTLCASIEAREKKIRALIKEQQ